MYETSNELCAGARSAAPRSALRLVALAVLLAVGAGPMTVSAAPGEPIAGTAGLWRDFRGVNNIGLVAGDRLEYRVDIEGGALGGTIAAQYRNTAGNLVFTSNGATCGPTSANPNQCGASLAFNPSRIAGTWTASVMNPTGTYSVALPSLVSLSAAPMPLVTDVRVTGTGSAPTFSWTLPTGAPVDQVTVTVYDNNVRRADRAQLSDAIFVQSLGASATSFTMPASFGSGLSLMQGGDYAFSINIRDTRNNLPGGGAANILNQSRSFFGFTPLTVSVPGSVYLPQVITTAGAPAPVYQFGFAVIDPNQTFFIDPASAIGYRYRIGTGDPNFASVLLPSAGDDDFLLSYLIGGQSLSQRLRTGQQFFFPQGGVSAFDVTDIEESAGLDPFNATAFVTGLTFTRAGQFTGTMEPIVAAIPVPASAFLMASGLGLIAWRLRRRST